MKGRVASRGLLAEMHSAVTMGGQSKSGIAITISLSTNYKVHMPVIWRTVLMVSIVEFFIINNENTVLPRNNENTVLPRNNENKL